MAIDNIRGYLYVAEPETHKVKRLNLQSGMIATVAGNGQCSPITGDLGAATNASLCNPTYLGLDPEGNLLIVDSGHKRIRRVLFQNTSSGVIAFSPTTSDLSTLTRNADLTWTRRYRNGQSATFDSSGRQIRATDRVGLSYQFIYSGDRLDQMIDPVGQITRYNYIGSKLHSITDPAQRSTNFQYNGDYLTQVTFPDGTTRKFGYDEFGLISSETNSRGYTTEYEYNAWNRLHRVIRPDGKAVTINDSASASAANAFTGGTLGKVDSVNAPNVHDGVKDPKSIEVKFKKDLDGFITQIVDADGKVMRIVRNARGQPVKLYKNFQENDPETSDDDSWDSAVTRTYDDNTGDLLSQTDSATGLTTAQTFDAFGNKLTETNQKGVTVTYSYSPSGQLLRTDDSHLGLRTLSEYNDPRGLTTAVTDASGAKTQIAYDSKGYLKTLTIPIAPGVAGIEGYSYDSAGNVLSKTDPDGKVTNFEYDVWNRLTAVVSPKGERTEYRYTQTGRISQIIDHLENITRFEYDELDQLSKKVDPLGYELVQLHDEYGNVKYEKDPNGNEKWFEYDSAGRMVRKILPEGVVELVYSDTGQLRSAQSPTSRIEFTYKPETDHLHKVRAYGIGEKGGLPDITLVYGYNIHGEKISLQDPTGLTQYTRDLIGRPIQQVNALGEKFNFETDSSGRLKLVRRPGSSSKFSYDLSSFQTSIEHNRLTTGALISAFGYGRNLAGGRTSITHAEGTTALTYDKNDRITGADTPGIASEEFKYDAVGNRKSDQGGDYLYDAKSQRLQEDYLFYYYYDANGNLIKKQAKAGFPNSFVTNYSYSSENQLTKIQVFEPGSNSLILQADYSYDVLGKRVEKKVLDYRAPQDSARSYTRRFVYDGEEILLEYDSSNRLLARYTHSGLWTDDVLSVNVTSAGKNARLAQAEGSYYYLKDAQGTVTEVVGGAGEILQKYSYSAFGKLLSIRDSSSTDITEEPIVSTSYAFTGREYDRESGLYYYRARYYDPSSGRFMQKDPYPGKLDLPDSVVNSYIYALNNPANRVDPTGRFSLFEKVLIGLTAVVAAVVAVVFFPVTLGVAGGMAVGALVGGVAGGLAGIGINVYKGRPWNDHIWNAIGIGVIAGALAGAVTGAIQAVNATSPLYADIGSRVARASTCAALVPVINITAKATFVAVLGLVFGAAAASSIAGPAGFFTGAGIAIFSHVSAEAIAIGATESAFERCMALNTA